MSDVLVTPTLVSTLTDNGDATKPGPNAWNAARKFAGGIVGDMLVRDAGSATGAAWVNASLRVFPLGGSRTQSVPQVATLPQNAANYLDIEVNGTNISQFTKRLRVEVRTLDALTSVTPRLRNMTDGTDAGTGVACSAVEDDYSGTDQIQVIVVTLAPGVKKYRLQLISSNADAPVFGIGYLEIFSTP